MLRGIQNIGVFAGANNGGDVVYNSYLQAVIDAATLAGDAIPSAATLLKWSNVLDAITDTEMAKIKQLFLFKKTESAFGAFCSYNLKTATKPATNVGVTFGTNGINTGGAAGSYFSTGTNLNSLGVTATDHAIGFMYVGAVTTGDYRCMGCYKSGTPIMKSEIYPYSGARTTNFLPLQNQAAAFHTFTRTASTGNNVYHMKVDGLGFTAYENGTLKMTKTLVAGTFLPALPMYLLAQNYDGTIVWKPSPNTCGAYYIGDKTLDESIVNTALQLL